MKSLILDNLDVCLYADDFKNNIYDQALACWCDRNMKSSVIEAIINDFETLTASFYFSGGDGDAESYSSEDEPKLELEINGIREIYFTCNDYIGHINSLYPSSNARLYLLEFALIFLQTILDKNCPEKTLDDILSNDTKDYFERYREFHDYRNNLLYTKQCSLEEYNFNCDICGHDTSDDLLVITSNTYRRIQSNRPLICCKYCYNYIKEHFPKETQNFSYQNLNYSDMYNDIC